MRNIFNRFGKLLIGIVAVVFGVLMILGGIRTNKNRKVFQPVTGVISQITVTNTDADGSNDYAVFVQYTVDGTDYEELLGEYSSSMHEGKEIELLYNPENPHEVQKAGMTSILIMIGFGAVVIVVGLAMILKFFR